MSIQKNQKIAVIGGNGFIGSHICRKILDTQVFSTLYIIDRVKVTVFENGVQSQNTLDEFNLKKGWNEIDIVIYLAWDSTPYSSLNEAVASNNLVVLKAYLLQLSDTNMKKFIFISSAGAIYKSEQPIVFNEKSDFSYDSPYAKEKLEAEKIILTKYLDKISVVVLRPSNVYGPGQLLKKGMGIIPKLFSSKDNNEAICLYEPPSSERDYLFISDFVQAVLLCTKENYPSGIYNLSSEENISLEELINIFNDINSSSIIFETKLKLKSNISKITSEKFQNISKWKSEVTISDGLKTTRDWYLQ